MKYGTEPGVKLNEWFSGMLGKKGMFFYVLRKKNLIHRIVVHFNLNWGSRVQF